MIDRRLFFWGAVLLAFGVLALMGWTPPVLWERAQSFVANATGAATATRVQSERREKREKDVGAVIDSMGGTEKEKPLSRPRHP